MAITRDEAREGLDEPKALELFLDYLRDGVIVAITSHDIQTLNPPVNATSTCT